MMKLYGMAPSPNTWKVRALAHHLSLPVEFKPVAIPAGENKRPEILALNPSGRLPILVDADFSLWESTAILQYLADKKPGTHWPQETRARADVVRWQCWQLAHWSKACEPFLFQNIVKKLFSLGPPDGAALAAAEATFDAEGRLLDQHLAKTDFLVANRLTLADFSVASYLIHAEAAAIPLARFPAVSRWAGRVLSLPCWQATAPTI